MTKSDIISILEEMGTLLELQGANPFKSRAFHNASRAVEGITEDIGEMVASGTVRTVKGIGEGIARVITDLISTGKSRDYDELKASVPAGVLEMLKIQGLGPKKVKVLYEKLNITAVADLEAAAKAGRLEKLDGFGKKTEENILQGIQAMRNRGEKSLYPAATGAAGMLLADIGKERGCAAERDCREHPETQGVDRRHRHTRERKRECACRNHGALHLPPPCADNSCAG